MAPDGLTQGVGIVSDKPGAPRLAPAAVIGFVAKRCCDGVCLDR